MSTSVAGAATGDESAPQAARSTMATATSAARTAARRPCPVVRAGWCISARRSFQVTGWFRSHCWPVNRRAGPPPGARRDEPARGLADGDRGQTPGYELELALGALPEPELFPMLGQLAELLGAAFGVVVVPGLAGAVVEGGLVDGVLVWAHAAAAPPPTSAPDSAIPATASFSWYFMCITSFHGSMSWPTVGAEAWRSLGVGAEFAGGGVSPAGAPGATPLGRRCRPPRTGVSTCPRPSTRGSGGTRRRGRHPSAGRPGR